MKKSIGLKKLSLKKETIAALDQLNQSQVQGGGGTVASACYSCMSQCLCNGGGQTAPGRPCCQAPGIA